MKIPPLGHPGPKSLFALCFLTGIAVPSLVIAAPAVTTPPVSALEKNFASPPAAARPWVYWFVMDGNFTREGITADLESMKAAGIGGVIFMEVNQGIPEGPVKFMSPEWQKLWAHAVHEAERLGLEITMNGGPGWCGTGGPWIKPEESMQSVTTSSVDVTGPKSFNEALPKPPNRTNYTDFYRDIKVLAFPSPDGKNRIANVDQKSFFNRSGYDYLSGARLFIPSYSKYEELSANQVVDSSKVIDLTANLTPDGKLNWQVPAGNWTIVRFGATNNGALTRPSPLPGLGLESDKFSKKALDDHYRDFIGSLLKAVGPRKVGADSGWNMLHIDSWEVGAQNWTPGFLNEFKTRRGYDASPYLPALSGFVVGSPEISERFLWDWRQTCQELVVQNHIAYFRDLGHKDGFGLSIEAYDTIVSSNESMGSAADVPMGEFWLYGGQSIDVSLGEAASEAHTTGKKIAGAEAFTSSDSEAWRAFPGMMKGLGDYAFTEGINRFVIHRYQHQPTLNQRPGMTMGPWGVHWERTQTWWDMVPAYHKYLARSQYMLRRGLPVSDICYLVPEGAPYIFRAPIGAARQGQADQPGYRFDACAPEVLTANMTVKDGALTLPDGTSYKVLVLPERDTMTPALLEKVARLVADGATVVGPRPVKSPSLSNYGQSDGAVQKLAAQVWGDCDGVKVTEHGYGKGRVIWHKSGQDLTGETPSVFENAQWIWYPEGQPSNAAPVGKRYFKRTFTIENSSLVAAAQLFMTADNSAIATVNGQPAGTATDWHKTWSFDVKNKLKNGENVIIAIAENGKPDDGSNTPNPAGFIGNLRLTYTDGHVVNVATNPAWQSAQSADGTWSTALSLGNSLVGPWNLGDSSLPDEYSDFGIVKGVLQDMKLPMDFESDGPIRYIHRRDGDAELYFVANREGKLVNANCTFRVTGKIPELWNPLTGERRSLPQYKVKGGQITVPLQFDAFQSWFIIFRSGKAAPQNTPNFPTLKKLGDINGSWQVSFDPKGGGPGKVTFPKLMDWSQSTDKGIHYYSGKATYQKSFTAPKAAPNTPLYLDLGTVNNLAQVKLNGRDLGVVWTAPWRVRLTNLHPGINSLEITVANLWPNRLIGDQGLPTGMRTTSTTWNPYRASDKLLPSGLLGPVTMLQGSTK